MTMTEGQLEQEALGWLTDVGWQHRYGPDLAPDGLGEAILGAIREVKDFSAAVHSGAVSGQSGKFERLLVIGIGGSALGPQLVAGALGQPVNDKLAVHFISLECILLTGGYYQ